MKPNSAVLQLQQWLSSHLTHKQQMQFEGLFQQAMEMELQHSVKNYKDELLNKLDSMVVTADRMFTEEAKKVTEMVIDNVKHHVLEIAKNYG